MLNHLRLTSFSTLEFAFVSYLGLQLRTGQFIALKALLDGLLVDRLKPAASSAALAAGDKAGF
jgi:hypothetical protein